MGKRSWRLGTILKQAMPVLLLAGIGKLVAGIVLKNYLPYIHLVPGIFVMLPALMNMRGIIQSSLAARLGGAYHLGLIKSSSGFGNIEIQQNFFAALVLSIILAVTCGFFAYFVCVAFGLQHISLFSFLFISVLATTIASLLMGYLNVIITVLSIKRHLDPDNVTIPLLTTFGDVFMLFLVLTLVVSFLKVIG